MAAGDTDARVEHAVRRLLAEGLGRPYSEIDRLPEDTELFGPELALTSLAGVALLTGMQREFGVDVADEDLNLDSLETIATLRDFVAARVASGPPD
ncbi:acyl carrier protein [Streptomyces sp. AJS327]|uniref:acyl carrier protein n=1 Tax=Streptomyces sp. AJS327 TaxID=2545265 RepID=UPI0015DE85FD|nr:acyl carrier protein [Streptomyces sp. AJS327]MBA0050621.1 acyl carrier protein [Streptomyces sp. AJS327]